MMVNILILAIAASFFFARIEALDSAAGGSSSAALEDEGPPCGGSSLAVIGLSIWLFRRYILIGAKWRGPVVKPCTARLLQHHER